MTRGWIAFLCAAGTAWSYVPRDPAGLNLHRADAANIQFLVNQDITPGLQNAQGEVWITGDSDPLSAIGAALKTWSSVPSSAVRFAVQRTSPAVNNAADRQNLIVFSDTEAIRSLLGSAIAITAISYSMPDGAILDTDILFNPGYKFSTTLAEGTVDLQSEVTHELGHALGANHTNVLGSAMFQSTTASENRQSSLSSDDIAFVSALYPAPGGNGYATVAGRAMLSDGEPIRGGLVTVINPANGVTVSGLTGLTDGSFRFQAPVGDYLVYVEPLGGYVLPGNFYLPDAAVDTNFQAFFLGGNESPAPLTLALGPEANLTLQAPAGPAVPRTPLYIGVGQAASSGEAILYQGPIDVTSGQSVDLVVTGVGLDPFTEQNLKILGGGVTIRAGTMRKGTSNFGGFPVYRVTMDIPPAAVRTLGTIVLKEAGGIVTLTGALSVGPPQVVNAASFAGGVVSPGEVVAFFGARVGPSTPVYAQLDSTGAVASAAAGVAITFDGVPAPLFYAGQGQVNVQVPYEIAGKQSTTMVAKYEGQTRGIFTIPVTTSHPGIITVTNADGSLNGPQSPATVGGRLVIWGTGVGITSIPAKTGMPSPADSTVQTAVAIGEIAASPDYAGLTPGGVGLMQANVTIPAGVRPGSQIPLKMRIGGADSQTVFISIR